MRTLILHSSSQGSLRIARWAPSAASSAFGAEEKAAQQASPTILKTWPSWAATASFSISSWRARALCILFASRSQSLVEPCMSVKRKVTVPVGGLATRSMSSSFPWGDTIAAQNFLHPFTHQACA